MLVGDCATLAGRSCVFPFIYEGETHEMCTLSNSESGKPWCATGVDANGKFKSGQWGYCNHACGERSKKYKEGMFFISFFAFQ